LDQQDLKDLLEQIRLWLDQQGLKAQLDHKDHKVYKDLLEK
jgi:hypothetical protein